MEEGPSQARDPVRDVSTISEGGPQEFDVDADEVSLLRDASLGRVRQTVVDGDAQESVTDDMVAAMAATGDAMDGALMVASTAAIPDGWTPGYSVPPRSSDEGRIDMEGERGWGMDPAAVALAGASFRRLSIATGGTPMQAAIQERFNKSMAALLEIVESAMSVKYEFRARVRKTDVLEENLSWARSLQMELASANMSAMWYALQVSARPSVSDMDTVKEFLDTALGQVVASGGSPDTANAVVDSVRQSITTTQKVLKTVRGGVVRLVMQAHNLDADAVQADKSSIDSRDGHGPLERLSMSVDPATWVRESVLFGAQHGEVERIILRSTMDEGVRYLFGPGTKLFSRDWAPHQYQMDRVRIQVPLLQRRISQGLAPKTVYGLRIRIPPPMHGYMRRNVVFAFRSLDASAPHGLRTDAILVGRIPDDSHWSLDSDPIDVVPNTNSVRLLPAAFLFHFTDRVDTRKSAGVFPQTATGYVSRSPGDGNVMEWQACYDVRWLESESGGNGRKHPTGNRLFENVMVHGYFVPVKQMPLPESPTNRPVSAPRVELFVEYVPDTPTYEAAVSQRRLTYARRAPNKGRPMPGGSHRIVSYFKPPESLTITKKLNLLPAKTIKSMPMIDPQAERVGTVEGSITQAEARAFEEVTWSTLFGERGTAPTMVYPEMQQQEEEQEKQQEVEMGGGDVLQSPDLMALGGEEMLFGEGGGGEEEETMSLMDQELLDFMAPMREDISAKSTTGSEEAPPKE